MKTAWIVRGEWTGFEEGRVTIVNSEEGKEERYKVSPLVLPGIEELIDSLLGQPVEMVVSDDEVRVIREWKKARTSFVLPIRTS